MKIRGHHIESWKLLIPICITFSFLVGAVASSAVILYVKDNLILLEGIGYFMGGVFWSIYMRSSRAWIEG